MQKKQGCSIFNGLGRMFRISWIDNIFRNAGKVLSMVKSGYITAHFNKIGVNVQIQSPIRIIGDRYISVGDNFSTLHHLRLEAYDEYRGEKFNPALEIGNNVMINTDCHFACINQIKIGNNVLIASRVFISDHYHGNINEDALRLPPSERPLYSKGSVIIGDNVWIGEGVAIMPDVEIGAGSIIGANSVVTASFPANSLIAGVPARLLRSIK